MKKEQLLIITHVISFHAQWKPRKQPRSKVPVKREFFWEQLTASVSMISLNLKSVMKSLCRPHFSRLNTPSSWDLQNRFLKPFNNFCWIPLDSLQILYNKEYLYILYSWPELQEKKRIAWQPLKFSLLHLYTLFSSLWGLHCTHLYWAIVCLQLLVLANLTFLFEL